MTAAVMVDVDLAGILTAISLIIAALAAVGWRLTNRSVKDVREQVGTANGNGPANQALHVLIEMQKNQDRKIDRMLEKQAEQGFQLDEITSIVSDHMIDPDAHRQYVHG